MALPISKRTDYTEMENSPSRGGVSIKGNKSVEWQHAETAAFLFTSDNAIVRLQGLSLFCASAEVWSNGVLTHASQPNSKVNGTLVKNLLGEPLRKKLAKIPEVVSLPRLEQYTDSQKSECEIIDFAFAVRDECIHLGKRDRGQIVQNAIDYKVVHPDFLDSTASDLIVPLLHSPAVVTFATMHVLKIYADSYEALSSTEEGDFFAGPPPYDPVVQWYIESLENGELERWATSPLQHGLDFSVAGDDEAESERQKALVRSIQQWSPDIKDLHLDICSDKL